MDASGLLHLVDYARREGKPIRRPRGSGTTIPCGEVFGQEGERKGAGNVWDLRKKKGRGKVREMSSTGI